MTSSLASIFDLGDRRALVVSADRATLYLWRRGTLANSFIFPADEPGLKNFERYLASTEAVPTYVMVDVVEEEYRQETVPHVVGRDRGAVIRRKQQRLFRGTDFSHAVMQGREKEGRRDDRVLLMALTKPDLVTPWLHRMLSAETPIQGIYSLPLVSQSVLKKLGASGRNVLLVSLQSSNGLRQTFFRDDQLKVSRLAPMPRLGTVPFASHLMGELEKLRRYLNSLALISHEAPLEIYLLSHGDYLDELEERCRDSDFERFYLVDVADAARRIGIPGALTTPYSDALFAYALLKSPPPNHYARHGDRHFHRLHRARSSMLAAGMGALVLSGMLSSVNFIEGISLKQQAIDAQNKADFYRRRFETARQGLPETPVTPRDIAAAVGAAGSLAHYRASPAPLMAAVGRVLAEMPDIELDRFDFRASSDPDAPVGDAAAAPEPAPGRAVKGEFPYYHLARISGRLGGFDGNYRRAVERVNQLAARIEGDPAVASVAVEALPIEIASDRAMSASADDLADRAEATFALRVVMGIPGPESG